MKAIEWLLIVFYVLGSILGGYLGYDAGFGNGGKKILYKIKAYIFDRMQGALERLDEEYYENITDKCRLEGRMEAYQELLDWIEKETKKI